MNEDKQDRKASSERLRELRDVAADDLGGKAGHIQLNPRQGWIV